MKTKLFFTHVLIIIVLFSCHKVEQTPDSSVLGIIKAKIDGKDWQSSVLQFGATSAPEGYFSDIYNKRYDKRDQIIQYFRVTGTDKSNVSLTIDGDGCPQEMGSRCGIFFVRGVVREPRNSGIIQVNNNIYYAIPETNYIEIIDADIESLTIEGRFSFTSMTKNKEAIDTVRVSEGYFKLTFPNRPY
ncbi:MAG: hypothetical protein MUE81_01880 [Thermoflexibacter sp.]|jgi:hypothetical protein|nr:hypothetical protein [Thermoflexibacter sp.]